MLKIDEQKAYEMLVVNLRKRAKEKLQASGKGIWRGKMLEELDAKIGQSDDGEFQIEIIGSDYMAFQDEGVNGVGFQKTKSGRIDNRFKSNRDVVKGSPYSYKNKRPPVEALTPWANSKGINPYAAVNSIYRKGIKPLHFLESTIDEELENFTDYLAEAQADSILNGFGD